MRDYFEKLRRTGAVRLHHPQVLSRLPDADSTVAELSVFATLENATTRKLSATLVVSFQGGRSKLEVELGELKRTKVILALGRVAHDAVLMALGLKRSQFAFGHGNEHSLDEARILVDSYHCSRYNTSTKVLTEPMFKKVVKRACELAGL